MTAPSTPTPPPHGSHSCLCQKFWAEVGGFSSPHKERSELSVPFPQYIRCWGAGDNCNPVNLVTSELAGFFFFFFFLKTRHLVLPGNQSWSLSWEIQPAGCCSFPRSTDRKIPWRSPLTRCWRKDGSQPRHSEHFPGQKAHPTASLGSQQSDHHLSLLELKTAFTYYWSSLSPLEKAHKKPQPSCHPFKRTLSCSVPCTSEASSLLQLKYSSDLSPDLEGFQSPTS